MLKLCTGYLEAVAMVREKGRWLGLLVKDSVEASCVKPSVDSAPEQSPDWCGRNCHPVPNMDTGL